MGGWGLPPGEVIALAPSPGAGARLLSAVGVQWQERASVRACAPVGCRLSAGRLPPKSLRCCSAATPPQLPWEGAGGVTYGLLAVTDGGDGSRGVLDWGGQGAGRAAPYCHRLQNWRYRPPPLLRRYRLRPASGARRY